MTINKAKLEYYINKLYRAELARYKKKKQINNLYSFNSFLIDEKNVKRVNPTIPQEKKVRDIYKNKCVICSKVWDKDDFELHHIDGDESKTITNNLVPMCHRGHRRITREAKAKLKDYINTHKPPPSGFGFNVEVPKPPTFKL